MKLILPELSGQIGLHFRIDFKKHLSFETGLLVHNYFADYDLKVSDSINITEYNTGYFVFQVPLRLRWKINLARNKIFLPPILGAHLCANPSLNQNGLLWNEIRRNNTDSAYVYQSSFSPHKTYILLETGLGIEFKIGRLGMLFFNTSYNAGFTKTYVLSSYSTHYNDPPVIASLYSKGSCWSFGLGYNFCISELVAMAKE